MPSCDEGYRSKEIDALMEKHATTCLEAAQTLHEHARGSSEVPPWEVADCRKIVMFYIGHWVLTDSEYDMSVFRLLVFAALEDYRKEFGDFRADAIYQDAINRLCNIPHNILFFKKQFQ